MNLDPELAQHLDRGSYIRINDGKRNINIFVRDEGPRDTSRAVLLLHGVPVSSFMYRKVIPYISQANYRCVSFDFPGLGLSDKPKDVQYTWDYYADIILRVVRQLGLEKLHMVVHDIGGPIGVDFAIQHPELVDSITFSNTLMDVTHFHQPFPMNTFSTPGLRQFTFFMFTNPLFAPIDYFIWKWRLSDQIDFGSVLAHGRLLQFADGKDPFFDIMTRFNLTQQYKEYLANGMKKNGWPSHLVWAKRDVIPRSKLQASYLTTNFPEMIKSETWLDTKHYPQEDEPQRFSDEIINFLKTWGGQTSSTQAM